MITRDLLRYLIPHRNTLILATVLMVGESVASLATPWFAGHFAKGLLGADDSGQFDLNLPLETLLWIWMLVFVAKALLSFCSTYIVTLSGAKILAKLSNRLYEHLQSLPMDFFLQRKRGDLLALLGNDIAILSHFSTGILTSLVPTLFTLIGAIFLMAMIDVGVAVLVLLLVPLFFVTLKTLGRNIRPVSEALVQKQADWLALAEENIGMIPVIKAFNREQEESVRFRDSTQRVLAQRNEQLKIQALLSPAIQLLASAGILLVLWISGQHLQTTQITTPELISLLLYGLLFARPVSSLANLYGQAQQAKGSSKRILTVFSVEPEPDDSSIDELPEARGRIEFCDLNFHYLDRPPVLKSLNLQINEGETVVITGPNGGGKTTLLHMLMRFYEPQQGKVLIDGHDISAVSLASLRQQLGFVSQHTLLSDGTIADNIRYGYPNASQVDVVAAARLACAHDFVEKLAQGYDTPIGILGGKLSGGQRQRIALARVLLGSPRILLLDEATSMFDSQGELAFLKQSGLMTDLTVILIAHSEAALALADRVLLLEGGVLADITAVHHNRAEA